MLQQAAIGLGMGIVLFGGLALLTFAPFLSVLTYDLIKWICKKKNPKFTRLKGVQKGMAIITSVLSGIVLASLIFFLIVWFLLKDVTYN